MSFRLLFNLFIISNLLHYISEKIIIIAFIIIFFYLLKIGNNLLEKEYILKVQEIKYDIIEYAWTNWVFWKYKRDVFNDIAFFCNNFIYHFRKIEKKLIKSMKRVIMCRITSGSLESTAYLYIK
jgi:hypothetical protein